MSRRHSAEKREINPDPKFGDLIVTKFMNAVMYDGKKSVAETIVYGALDQVQSKTKQEPVTVFHQRSTMSRRMWKCVRVASAAPPTRFRSTCVPSAARHWPSVG